MLRDEVAKDPRSFLRMVAISCVYSSSFHSTAVVPKWLKELAARISNGVE